MIPADSTLAPALTATCASARAICGPDSRVSRPITMLGGLPRSRARFETSDRPIITTVPSSSGYCPAMPLIPSVPNNFCVSPFGINLSPSPDSNFGRLDFAHGYLVGVVGQNNNLRSEYAPAAAIGLDIN